MLTEADALWVHNLCMLCFSSATLSSFARPILRVRVRDSVNALRLGLRLGAFGPADQCDFPSYGILVSECSSS